MYLLFLIQIYTNKFDKTSFHSCPKNLNKLYFNHHHLDNTEMEIYYKLRRHGAMSPIKE